MTLSTLRPLTLALAAAAIAAAWPQAHADETVRIGPRQLLEQQRSRDAALDAAARWAERNPERYRRLVPPDADLSRGSVEIEVRQRDGSTRIEFADGLSHTVVDLGYTERLGSDRTNLERLYTQLHAMIPADYLAGLPVPAQVVGAPVRQLKRAVQRLAERLVLNFVDIRLDISRTVGAIPGVFVNPIGVCSSETGFETAGTDSETSSRCDAAAYAALGLLRNLDFVLEDDLTCVKSQGRRGTCVAHAVAANVETMIQVLGGSPENLAEQDLYHWAKINTDMSGRYQDGLSPDEVYDALDAQDFRIQWESQWNYNRSPDRLPLLPVVSTFPLSCDPIDYTGEMCTDYAFQAIETALVPGLLYTYTSPARASTGWQVRDWVNLPDLSYAGLPDFQIDTAIVALESEYPVHFSISVTPSLSLPDPDGYIRQQAFDLGSSGSHSMLAVGFVANADLPAGVAPDPDGRGYVIVKNSWGTGYGDCGFAYVSTEYLRLWAYAFRYLGKTVVFN
jgi:hypothetical protein